MVEEENSLIVLLGESRFEELFDWIELCAEEAAYTESSEKMIPAEILNLGDSIERFILHESDFWIVGDSECRLHEERISELAEKYFKNVIFPYLQMESNSTFIIKGESNSTCKLFEKYLINNGCKCVQERDESTIVKNISIKGADTLNMLYVKGNEFKVRSDIGGKLIVTISIEQSSGVYKDSDVAIYFPWYRKNDYVVIDIIQNKGKWLISSRNTSRNFEYMGEIEIC